MKVTLASMMLNHNMIFFIFNKIESGFGCIASFLIHINQIAFALYLQILSSLLNVVNNIISVDFRQFDLST
jgi:uncharacterized membrane protein YtjA (UPF0391 family)